MTNNQKVTSEIYYNKLPISRKLKLFLIKNSLKKSKFIFNGDDYQILFTAKKSKRDYINKISKVTKTKISRIGRIISKKKFRFRLLNGNKVLKMSKTPGYEHFFS